MENIINNKSEYYIKEIRRYFDSFSDTLDEKKQRILRTLESFSEGVHNIQNSTQKQINTVKKNIITIMSDVNPVRSLKSIQEHSKEIFEKYLENIYNAIKSQTEKIQMDDIMQKLEPCLSKIFFNKQERNNEFERLKKTITTLSVDKINEFINKNPNKTISKTEWKDILATGIRKWSLGLTGYKTEDRIKILSTLSYYSLQTCLRVGIDTGLFIQNVMKYFPQKIKEMKEFETNFNLAGGLALTEKTSGSDLFSDICTTYTENSDGTYTIEGVKHYQGLTNEATHWIVLAKDKKSRKIKLFYLDTRIDGVDVEMTEKYNMNCLPSITYGVNTIDARVGKDCVFNPKPGEENKILRYFQGLLYDSRMQFPAMAGGYLKRIFDESRIKAGLRKISNSTMDKKPYVQEELATIQAYSNINEAINQYVIENIQLEGDNRNQESLSILCKTLSTEYMVKSGQKAQLLQGGDGALKNNLIYSLLQDAWPFCRFEGVNEMLYANYQKIIKKFGRNLSPRTEETLAKNKVQITEETEQNLNDSKLGELYVKIKMLDILHVLNIKSKNAYKVVLDEILNLINQSRRESMKIEL